jgi:hypothetical protein
MILTTIPDDILLAINIIAKRGQELQSLANRYDDAMKRIHDLTAELEHLRREVNRG